MVSEHEMVSQLSEAGYRITRARRAVIRALLDDDGYSTPAQIHARARSHDPDVGLVSVYRTLDLLSNLRLARRIHTEDGCHGYASASQGHRHHILCRRCGAAVEFEGCDLSPLLGRVETETGYTVEEHLLELVGLCPACR